MSQRTATCPVEDCEFSDTPSQVAAHVNGVSDSEHDWSELPYDGPDEFLQTARTDDSSGIEATTTAPDAEATTTGSAPTSPDAGLAPTISDDYSDLLPEDDLIRAVRATFGLLEKLEADSIGDLPLDDLVNLFTVFSVLSSAAGNARSEVREEIIERVDGNVDLSAAFGTVSHSVQTSRTLRDEETVRRRLQNAGIDPADVEAIDEGLVAETVDAEGLDEESVFELEERESVRRAEVNEDALEEFDANQ